MVPFAVPRMELAQFVHRGTISPSDAQNGMLEAREGFTLAGGAVKPMALLLSDRALFGREWARIDSRATANSLLSNIKIGTALALLYYRCNSQAPMPGYTTLIIDDFESFRRFILLALQQRAEFQAIYQASDGLEGVQLAEELRPDLILLDIGLPRMNGIEAARRIGEVSPSSKILFITQESSVDVVQEALSLGVHGYMLKGNAASELLFAVETVLRGERFISPDLNFTRTANARPWHEIIFCSDEEALLNGLADFLAAALKAGDAAIVWATESHREALRSILCGQDVDVDSAIRSGTYISSDVSEPADRERILAAIKGLSAAAFKLGKKHPRVAVCGERAGRLWAERKIDAALHIEKLLNELVESHAIDILCVYPFPQSQEEDSFNCLCAEHSGVCYR